MRRNRWTTAALVTSALMTVGATAAARDQAAVRGRVLKEVEKGDAVSPVVDAMRTVRHQAGFFGALALPKRFAGKSILDPTEGAAERSTSDPHYLTYGFSDGADLLYYSDYADDYATVSVWETGADGVSGTSLYGTVTEGSYASTSLGFYESTLSGDDYLSSGVSMWKGVWADEGTVPDVSAMVSEYTSSYGSEGWSYEGVDHHYADFTRVTYSGSGSVSYDGAFSNFEGISVVEDASGRVQECISTGQSMSDSGDKYGVFSDYWDECEQYVEPFNFYSAHNHTEYVWTYATSTSSYEYSGSVECSDRVGVSRRFSVEYDPSSWGYRYTDVDSGEEVPSVDCAWDPWAEAMAD